MAISASRFVDLRSRHISPSLAELTALVNTAMRIEDIGYYPPTWQALQEAISYALSVVRSHAPEQGQILLATQMLTRAMGDLIKWLSIDFAAGEWDEALDFSRASTATYWGPEGSLLEAAVDEARIQHDPVTGEPLGVLVESSATNVETTGRALDSNEYWNTAVVPDDKFGQAFHLTSPNENIGFRGNYSSFSAGGGEYGQLRVVYVKRVNCRYVAYWATLRSNGIVFDLDEGVFLYGDPAVSEYLGDGWWKLHLYRTWGGATANQFRFSYGSTFTDFHNDICQRQEGDQILIGSLEIYDTLQENPPTPLQTQDSPVTRAADEVSIDLSDVFNPDEGTLRITAQVPEGEVVATLGGIDILSDSDELKEYTLIHGDSVSGSELTLGYGIFQSLEYLPEAQS